MRALVVAGLVVFHSAVVFAAGASWFVTDPQPSIGFTVFLLWGSLWGMPLLFLASGMGARYAMRTRPAGSFARERLARLLVPFAAGLLLVVPPMFYLERLGQPGFHRPSWRFWLGFVNLPAIARGLLPRGAWTSGGVTYDPAHLWFLYVLLVFSIALLPLFSYLRGPHGARLTEPMAALTERHPAVALSLAAIPIMAVDAAFGPDVNTGGWQRLAYVFPFGYGFLIASDPRFETALRRTRRPALASALAATAALVAWAAALNNIGHRSRLRRPARLGRAARPGRLGVDHGDPGLRRVAGRPPGRPAAGHARPAADSAPDAVAARRPVRQRGRARFLPPARAGHRRRRVGPGPLARPGPRQVRRAGDRIPRRDHRPVRGAGAAVPPHPAPVRHEAPGQARTGETPRQLTTDPG